MKTIKNLTADELRKSILQLAIQGKLVKQDPNDEPASELVKRIYEEKNKLIAEGKIKKDKNQSYIFKGDDNCYYEKIRNNEPVKLEDLPFDIPDNWMWIRLGMSCKLIGTGIDFFKGEKQYYSTGSIKENNFVPEGSYNFQNRPSRANRIAVMGELIDAKMQNTVKVQIIDNRLAGSLLSTGFYALKNYINNIEYIKLLILSNYFQNSKDKKCSGTTQKAITDEELSSIIIPLPPLEEQQRIVDKINSFEPLLEKYDKVEKELSKLEKEFPEKLKKSILQYAIEGKLVKQDPNDEPASALLERIKQEKERLIKEGKIKRDKNESYIYQGDDKDYYKNFPSNWVITKYQNVILEIFGGGTPSKSKPRYWNGDIPWCSVKDLGNNLFINNTQDTITIEGLNNSSSRIVEAGNIILCTRMAVGKIRIPTINMAINQDLKGIVLSHYIDKTYFINHVLTNSFKGTGTTVKGINQSDFLDEVFYLPPLNEQLKIVNKIKKINLIIDL